jgi:aryl-alcohol dehydrogenase-like predicted oxidoreductase
MKTNKLGTNGPEISAVGFGAWEAGGGVWGPNPSDDQVIAAMRAGFDAGMTWIDTAEVYGGGLSEQLVGRAVKGRDVLVFTKVAPKGAGSGFDAASVRRACEQSLKRLGRDVIDLYQLHWPTQKVPVEETWGAMAQLVDDGLVRHIGVSNFNQSLIEKCESIRHVDSLQPEFSMLQRNARNDGLLRFCAQNGTGVIAYGPLAYGLLTGVFDRDTNFSDDDWRSGKQGMGQYEKYFAPGIYEKNIEIADRLRPIADRVGITPAQLAIAWVTRQEGATGAIVGSRDPDHVRENAAAGDVDFPEKDMVEVEEILAAAS